MTITQPAYYLYKQECHIHIENMTSLKARLLALGLTEAGQYLRSPEAHERFEQLYPAYNTISLDTIRAAYMLACYPQASEGCVPEALVKANELVDKVEANDFSQADIDAFSVLFHQLLAADRARPGQLDTLVEKLIQGIQVRPTTPEEFAMIIRRMTSLAHSIANDAQFWDNVAEKPRYEVAAIGYINWKCKLHRLGELRYETGDMVMTPAMYARTESLSELERTALDIRMWAHIVNSEFHHEAYQQLQVFQERRRTITPNDEIVNWGGMLKLYYDALMHN